MAVLNDYNTNSILDPDFGDFGGGGFGGNANNLIRIDDSGGGDSTGGGGFTGGGGIKITPPNTVFNITSNVIGASVLINGVASGQTTPAQLTITKADLIQSGNKTITLSKTGYGSKQKYVISLNGNGASFIENDNIQNQIIGTGVADIACKYYIDDVEQVNPNSTEYGNLKNLVFSLSTKIPPPVDDDVTYELNINIIGNTGGNPVLLEKNSKKGAQMFPAIGATKYSDIPNTNYKISSSDEKLYRITEISYRKGGTTTPPTTLVSEGTESLVMNFILNEAYKIIIKVEDVEEGVSGVSPEIELIKKENRLYNINSETGVPIAFKKNAAVEVVTVIIGDDVLEFDDLADGDIGGITIPHSAFKVIGNYNIEIFPFSLNDYGKDDIAVVKPPLEIIKPPIEIVEEPVKEEPQIGNPYVAPNPGSGGSVGSNNGSTTILTSPDNITGGGVVRIDEPFKQYL
jgi:hypothetical protein